MSRAGHKPSGPILPGRSFIRGPVGSSASDRFPSDDAPPGQRFPSFRRSSTPLHSDVSDHPDVPFSPLYDRALDAFLESRLTHPFAESLERSLRDVMHFFDVVFWQDIPILSVLYSNTRNVFSQYSSCLAGFCRTAGSVIIVPAPTKHGCYGAEIDGPFLPPSGGVVLAPLCDETGSIYGVLELIKQTATTDQDRVFGDWIARKLRLLKKWIDPPAIDPVLLALGQFGVSEEFFANAAAGLGCRAFEVWRLHKSSLVRYGVEKAGALPLAGLVYDCLVCGCTLNKLRAEDASGFSDAVDRAGESVLCLPVSEPSGVSYGFVLRGALAQIFTSADESNVAKLARHVIVRVERSPGGASAAGQEGSSALSAMSASLSMRREPERVLSELLDRCRVLLSAERCTFFQLSEGRDRLVSCHQTGLRKSINIPLNRGLAGQAVVQQQVVMEASPYQSPLFDPRVDAKTGFRTRSVLVVPAANPRGDVVGCIEFLNKVGIPAFTQADSRVAQAFAPVALLLAENTRLARDAANAGARGKLLAQAAIRAAQSADWLRAVEELLRDAHAGVRADRSAFFVLRGAQFELAVANGAFSPTLQKTGIAEQIVLEKSAVISPEFVYRELDAQDASTRGSVLAMPVLSVGPKVLGFMCFLSPKPAFFNANHVDFVTPFATFCALAVQTANPEDIEITRWMTADERSNSGIPLRLQLTHDEINTVCSLACFSPDFRGVGHFKELFFFFHAFDFLEQFKITAERFFRFIYLISIRYTSTPYHNWTHACDVTQCMFFMIRQGKLVDSCMWWELFALLVAGICHDTGHEGLNNVYNVKVETPLGILYKDLSVLEFHHVHESFPIIQRPDVDLFGGFDSATSKKVWTLFVRLILATDMARHFELLKRGTAALDEGVFDMTLEEWKLLALQLVMKVGDISNVSRPFEYADKWCDILNEEFFHQGDLEKQSIGLTAPLNDRETSNKPKSQIGFYSFICLPLYTLVARLFPPLQVQVDSVKSNLDHWKGLSQ